MSAFTSAIPSHARDSGSGFPSIALSLVQNSKPSFDSRRDSQKNRPTPLRIHSTPPDSPTEPHKMTTTPPPPAHKSAALTPPETPAALRYNKFVHGAPFAASSPEHLRTATTETNPAVVISDIPRKETERGNIMVFTDYEIVSSELIGSGYWSDVYAGREIPSGDLNPFAHDPLTPPSTPSRPTHPHQSWPTNPNVYAVKTPAHTSARVVLLHEARVLTHLHSLPGHAPYIVPFYGFDQRNHGLILGLLPQSLEDYVMHTLAPLPENLRTNVLACAIPSLTHHLIAGLEFIHNAGVVHSDIKPSNILLRNFQNQHASESKASIPVYADFSSSIILLPSPDKSAARPELQAPLGGGSWDFLSPNLVKPDPVTGLPPDPAPADDVYALAITLLFIIIGRSPYAEQGWNVFQRREMVKAGRAVEFATDDMQNAERLKCLTRAVQLQRSADEKTVGEHGFSFRSFLNLGLRKNPQERIKAGEWKKWLDEHGVTEPEELEDWCRACEHPDQALERKDSLLSRS